jgi:protein TonB
MRLLTQLERYKRYPREARMRNQEGVVAVRFRLDESGHVLAASIARSSGFPALDDEVLQLLRRAEPLPPPPGGEPIEIVAPIRFALR